MACKRGSVGQSEGLSIPGSSVRFRLKPENSNSQGFEPHRHSIKGTKLLFKNNKSNHHHQLSHKMLEVVVEIIKRKHDRLSSLPSETWASVPDIKMDMIWLTVGTQKELLARELFLERRHYLGPDDSRSVGRGHE